LKLEDEEDDPDKMNVEVQMTMNNVENTRDEDAQIHGLQ
jgi:hypothetical protein